jgi:hypothetical protein
MEPLIITLAIVGAGFVTGYLVRDRSIRRRFSMNRKLGL